MCPFPQISRCFNITFSPLTFPCALQATSFAPKQENTRAVWSESVHVNFLSGHCGARENKLFHSAQTPLPCIFIELVLLYSNNKYAGGEGGRGPPASGDLADFLQTEKRDAGRGGQSPLSLFSHDGRTQPLSRLRNSEKLGRKKKGPPESTY